MISLIVPVYKVEEYLPKCIDSILAQTYKDWELLLIDDGSPDRSGEICDEYAATDNRIRVYHQSNAGASSARNKGIEKAQGEYIVFADADDIVSPYYLSHLANTDYDIVINSYSRFGEVEEDVIITQNEEIYYREDIAEFSKKYLIDGTILAPYCKLFKTSIIKRNSIRFPLGMKNAEDIYFVLDYIKHCSSFIVQGYIDYKLRYAGETYAAKYAVNAKEYNFHIKKIMSHISTVENTLGVQLSALRNRLSGRFWLFYRNWISNSSRSKSFIAMLKYTYYGLYRYSSTKDVLSLYFMAFFPILYKMKHRGGVNAIKEYLHYRRFYLASIGIAKEENDFAKKLKCEDLSSEEITMIRDKWLGIIKDQNIGYGGFQVYKHYYQFDANYVPFSYYFPWMARILSPIDSARTFADKGMTYTFFHNIKQPELVLRKVRGCVLDKYDCVIENTKIAITISNSASDVIIKQSLGSYCGQSVRIIKKGTPTEDIFKIISLYDGDFVVQKVLKQSTTTSRFNESSLNTFRLSTLLLNGKFSVCTSMLRFGNPGHVVDNVGAGGGCVGINDDGTLMPFGFNKRCEKIYEWNGLRFEGLNIPEYDKLVEAARKAHYDIPLCAFVGWDLAIDESGEINLIEANLEWPGLFFEQIANARPAFRDRLDEVLHYIKTHPLPLLPLYDATN